MECVVLISRMQYIYMCFCSSFFRLDFKVMAETIEKVAGKITKFFPISPHCEHKCSMKSSNPACNGKYMNFIK